MESSRQMEVARIESAKQSDRDDDDDHFDESKKR
jgi:hypothetical protein